MPDEIYVCTQIYYVYSFIYSGITRACGHVLKYRNRYMYMPPSSMRRSEVSIRSIPQHYRESPSYSGNSNPTTAVYTLLSPLIPIYLLLVFAPRVHILLTAIITETSSDGCDGGEGYAKQHIILLRVSRVAYWLSWLLSSSIEGAVVAMIAAVALTFGGVIR